MIISTHGKAPQLQVMSSVQINAIMGLERLIHATGLILTCPTCAADGHPQLDTDNDPESPVWKIDCGCRQRRVQSTDVGRAMDADGELMLSAESILSSLNLVLRCPERRCLTHHLEVTREPEAVIVRCRCAKTTLRAPQPTRH